MKKEILAISAFTAAAGVVYYIDTTQTVPTIGQLQARATEESTPENTPAEPEPEGSEGEDAGAKQPNCDEYIGDPEETDSEDIRNCLRKIQEDEE